MIHNEKFNIINKKKPIILVAPLDWGLGHATRDIPIINHLISIGCEVIVAAGGFQLALLQEEFPGIRFEKIPGYGFTLSNKGWKTIIKILLQIPKILISINKEKAWLKEFLRQTKVDAIISDNRYGFYDNSTSSVFITHQLTIKTPFGKFFDSLLRKLNYHYINKFTECWVPDFEGSNNMGGILSHPEIMPSLPVKFIGRLSRIHEGIVDDSAIELLIILSGPEPQRSIFEKILIHQLASYPKSVTMIRGLPGEKKPMISPYEKLAIYNHLSSFLLNNLMLATTYVISRSGYSTVMDLTGLHKKCIFVPTPGQTEQEYLALHLSSRKICLTFKQKNFSLSQAIEEAGGMQFEHFGNAGADIYKKIITDFIQGL